MMPPIPQHITTPAARYAYEHSLNKAAAEFRISEGPIRRRMIELGLPRKPNGAPPSIPLEVKIRAARLVIRDHLTNERAAKALGISHETVRRILLNPAIRQAAMN